MTKLLFVLLLFLLIDICYASSSDSQDVIVFLFIALLIGALITYILARFAKSLPYTVVVFAIGALISASFSPVNDHNVLKISLTMWDNIQPDLILFIFLPALLFGEAMSLTFHHIRGAFTSAALLAGPGALFGAMLLGVLAKYTLPYGWGWSLCFTFGSILCATDPVGKLIPYFLFDYFIVYIYFFIFILINIHFYFCPFTIPCSCGGFVKKRWGVK